MSDELRRLQDALAKGYAIEREIGAGGMATVYLAEDLKHHRQVAIKVFKQDLAAVLGPDRFLREIEIAARLHHPHILPLYDSGEAGGFLFYTMPYVEGESLRDRLDREKQLPIDDALHIAREVADALSYAHSHAVVHRDVKPENIMLEADHAVVTDFGIARAISAAGGDRLTQTGMALGTPAYMSPEQVGGDSDLLDGRSDLYGLGCVLYEMLAGEPPFTGPTTESILHQHLTAEPRSVTVLRPAVPADIAGTVARALSKTPADRFSPAAVFAEALTQAQTAAVPAVARPRRRNLLWPAIVVGAVLVAALTVPRMLQRPGPAVIPQPQQVTFEGTVLGATISGDGQFVAYVTQDAGVQRLMVSELGGTPLEVGSFGFLCCARWSPDGTQLVFHEGTRGNGRTVVVPRLGGTSPREINAEIITSWSPGGEVIASWWPQAKEVLLTELSTGDTIGSIDLSMPHVWVNGVDWSPDGDRLAVAVAGEGTNGIWIFPVAGGGPRQVVEDTVAAYSPHWAAGGTAIHYLRGDDERAVELRKISVSKDGTSRGLPKLLLSGLSVNLRHQSIPLLSFTQDGSRLLYTRRNARSNLWLFDIRSQAGRPRVEARQLTRGTAVRSNPRISPDGGSVAFVSSTGNEEAIFVASLPDGSARQLTFMNAHTGSPAWSPDGSRIAFVSDKGGTPRIWTIDAAGGTAKLFENTSLEAGNRVSWAPSEEIVYQLAEDRDYVLLDVKSGSQDSLLPSNEIGWLYQPRPSPDGERIAVWWNRTDSLADGLWILPTQGGHPFLLRAGFSPIGWTEAGDALYALRNLGNDEPVDDIYVIAVNGSEPELYVTLPHAVTPREVSITADGMRIVAAVYETQSDAWAIENFDPERR